MNEFVVTINGQKKNIRFLNGTEIFVDDIKYEYELIKLISGSYLLRLNNKFYEIPQEIKNGGGSVVSVGGENFEVMVRSMLQEKAAGIIELKNAASYRMEVKAPMPGMIVKIKTSENSHVSQGDAVLILEAMKMENEVRSPFNGTLKEIFVKEGMAVEKGAKLFLIE
jgi:biotin carboxyl carrier protein